MKGNTDIVATVEAWASSEGLLHRWVGTGSACKVCVSANRYRITRTSCEIMVRRSKTMFIAVTSAVRRTVAMG